MNIYSMPWLVTGAVSLVLLLIGAIVGTVYLIKKMDEDDRYELFLFIKCAAAVAVPIVLLTLSILGLSYGLRGQ